MQSFRPSPPHDLLRPTPGSTTARAIVSLVRRTRFEAWKALSWDLADSAAMHDLEALHAVLGAFLPGNPHAVSAVLSVPTVGEALRAAVGGALDLDGHRAPPDPSAVPRLCTSALLALQVDRALAHEVRLESPVDVTLFARDVALRVDGGPATFGPHGVVGAAITRGVAQRAAVGVLVGGEVAALEAGLATLEGHAPGMSAELRRVALELVEAPPSFGFARCFGRFELRLGDAESTARALAVERVRHLLTGLAEVDALADRPAALVQAALAFAAGEPLDEARWLALDAAGPTEVGAGIVAELRRG